MTAYDFVSKSEYVNMIDCIRDKKPFQVKKEKRSAVNGFIRLDIHNGTFQFEERMGEYYVAVDTNVKNAGTGMPVLWDEIIKDWATYESFIEDIGKIISRYEVLEQDDQIRFVI